MGVLVGVGEDRGQADLVEIKSLWRDWGASKIHGELRGQAGCAGMIRETTGADNICRGIGGAGGIFSRDRGRGRWDLRE